MMISIVIRKTIRQAGCLLTLWAAIVPWVQAEEIPNRYVVEMSTEPVAQRASRLSLRGRARLESTAALAHRQRIRDEQSVVRARVERHSGRVLGSVDTVANAMFVEMPAEEAAKLALEPGVKRVRPERTFHMVLDRAVQLHKINQAWEQVGASRAGEGIKIAIIDSGIDPAHAAFANSELSAPAGFPRVSSPLDSANTNGKIIAARSYVPLLRYRDPDNSVRDHVGHGTALAMITAGGKVDAPLAQMQGVSPRAWIGVYKVFGTPGYNDSSNDAAIITAIEDAVLDGMDVINLSLGDDFAYRLADDFEVAAIEQAAQAGVIVVVAAGNNGPGMNTIASPGTAPSAITIGATTNGRTFGTGVTVDGLGSYVAYVGSGPTPGSNVQGELVDVSTLDGDGLACAGFSSGAASGKIALILRGSCTFETKLLNAQRAGAVGALVYATAESPEPITMSVGAATLPAQMVSNGDGVAVKQQIAAGTATATMNFTIQAIDRPANRVTDFSAVGPSVDLGIKPDLMATGGDIYTATQKLDSYGDMYNPSGYVLVDGTSFATPMIAGAAALLKAARPGLAMEDYRSLLVNTGVPVTQTWKAQAATMQQTGAGVLDMMAALQSTATASPVSLSFGVGSGTLDAARSFRLKNTGTETESFEIKVVPSAVTADGATEGLPAPLVEQPVMELAAGASVEVPVRWVAQSLASGHYEGVLQVTGLTSGEVIRVPYWHAVQGDPHSINLMYTIDSARRGTAQSDAFFVRVTDSSGVIITETPTVKAVSGGGAVLSVTDYNAEVPGLFGVSVQLGTVAGTNTFRVTVGQVTLDVQISGL
ncbi:MAG: S8 family serine peptidase [Acidobacteria bacterium]|nr:S8 family serine peptidase [Acidobacteriota bacterium]